LSSRWKTLSKILKPVSHSLCFFDSTLLNNLEELNNVEAPVAIRVAACLLRISMGNIPYWLSPKR
jgi:hypothetical protein